jgi:hypothetical protein
MLQTPFLPRSVFRPPPPPLWYVTNGDLTVGPVDTGLLIRGIEHGRVPDYCHVRAFSGDWRHLYGVREVAALHGNGASGPSVEQLAEWGRFLERVRDEDELCHTAAWLSLVSTGAESAMFHYRGGHSRSLYTRSVLGPVSNARLGYPLSEFDLVLRSARRGLPVQGPPYGLASDGLAQRFAITPGAKPSAVAMIPILIEGELAAMIELARPGHAFRCSDLQGIERILQRAVRARSS